MHPAPSIILFTTLSGAGYGLLALAGLYLPLTPGGSQTTGVVAVLLGGALVVGGLMSSTFHLRHPERAWRALTQWRSSWLSREGVMAILSFLPLALFAWGVVIDDNVGGAFAAAGFLLTALAVVTVFCTAMIYASLRPIAAWRDPLVPPLFLIFGVQTGAQLGLVALVLGDGATPVAVVACLALTAIAWGAVALYWSRIARTPMAGSAGTALGLSPDAKVRPVFDAHSEENYLLHEFAFQVGRKHAAKLRRIALALGLGGTALFTLLIHVSDGLLAVVPALLAAACALGGAMIQRWLFFAEARHAVRHYYGGSGSPDRTPG